MTVDYTGHFHFMLPSMAISRLSISLCLPQWRTNSSAKSSLAQFSYFIYLFHYPALPSHLVLFEPFSSKFTCHHLSLHPLRFGASAQNNHLGLLNPSRFRFLHQHHWNITNSTSFISNQGSLKQSIYPIFDS